MEVKLDLQNLRQSDFARAELLLCLRRVCLQQSRHASQRETRITKSRMGVASPQKRRRCMSQQGHRLEVNADVLCVEDPVPVEGQGSRIAARRIEAARESQGRWISGERHDDGPDCKGQEVATWSRLLLWSRMSDGGRESWKGHDGRKKGRNSSNFTLNLVAALLVDWSEVLPPFHSQLRFEAPRCAPPLRLPSFFPFCSAIKAD